MRACGSWHVVEGFKACRTVRVAAAALWPFSARLWPFVADHMPAALFSTSGITLLFVLPFCNICGFLWAYTALPLHFYDTDLEIWSLSLLLTLCYAVSYTHLTLPTTPYV